MCLTSRNYLPRGPTEPDQYYEERVLEVRRDPNRTSHIALVAGQNGKRWILATENMRLALSFFELKRIFVQCRSDYQDYLSSVRKSDHRSRRKRLSNRFSRSRHHDSQVISPVCLRIYSFFSVERYPTEESDVFVVAAGSAATVVRHHGDFTVVRVTRLVFFSKLRL